MRPLAENEAQLLLKILDASEGGKALAGQVDHTYVGDNSSGGRQLNAAPATSVVIGEVSGSLEPAASLPR
jgi:hypothetical protein